MHIRRQRNVPAPGMVVLFKEATMELDVDTFLTTVYCIVDELYQRH